jgi:phosphoribosyl-AMP cyclohydrolase
VQCGQISGDCNQIFILSNDCDQNFTVVSIDPLKDPFTVLTKNMTFFLKYKTKEILYEMRIDKES